MDGFDNSFYPAPLTDYEVTSIGSHPQSSGYPNASSSSNINIDSNIHSNLHIDLDSFAGGDIPPLPPLPKKSSHPHTHPFDEAFSDVVSNYDQQWLADQPAQEAKTPPLDSEDPLLRFSAPSFHYPLLDYTYRAAPVSLDAQLTGMFFSSFSEGPPLSGAGEEAPAPQQSVTCYRRNLFSIVGSITLPRSLRYISTDHGEQIPVMATEMTLSATESMEGASVKLISVPYKSATVPPGVEEKADKDPASIPLDLTGSSEMDSSFVTLPVVWKRLQFRSSTANNGRRKELQQTYSCRISLIATLSTGQRVSLCDMATEPIVVRGRSPRAFAAKKEAPTSGSIHAQPRAKPSMPRHATTDGVARLPTIKSETDYNFDFTDLGITSDPWVHRDFGHHGALTALPPNTFRNMNPNEFFAQSSPDISRYNPPVHVPAPVNLSLTDEEVKKPSPSPAREGSSRKVPRLAATNRPPSFSLNSLQSAENDDGDNPLYEYFPLSLDDWQEPVDAVYRPHVVHHITLPAATKDTSRIRSKRYFSVASAT